MDKRYYRFSTGTFIEAASFEEAKSLYLLRIKQEQEASEGWHACTCLGFSHAYSCPMRTAEDVF